MNDARNLPAGEEGAGDADLHEGVRPAETDQRRTVRELAHEELGTNPQDQPGIPDDPTGPAEGGD